MNTLSPPCITATGPGYQLRFASLRPNDHSLVFPCDAQGEVALDHLGERARNNYFFARAVVGRDFARPVVEPKGH